MSWVSMEVSTRLEPGFHETFMGVPRLYKRDRSHERVIEFCGSLLRVPWKRSHPSQYWKPPKVQFFGKMAIFSFKVAFKRATASQHLHNSSPAPGLHIKNARMSACLAFRAVSAANPAVPAVGISRDTQKRRGLLNTCLSGNSKTFHV